MLPPHGWLATCTLWHVRSLNYEILFLVTIKFFIIVNLTSITLSPTLLFSFLIEISKRHKIVVAVINIDGATS